MQSEYKPDVVADRKLDMSARVDLVNDPEHTSRPIEPTVDGGGKKEASPTEKASIAAASELREECLCTICIRGFAEQGVAPARVFDQSSESLNSNNQPNTVNCNDAAEAAVDDPKGKGKYKVLSDQPVLAVERKQGPSQLTETTKSSPPPSPLVRTSPVLNLAAGRPAPTPRPLVRTYAFYGLTGAGPPAFNTYAGLPANTRVEIPAAPIAGVKRCADEEPAVEETRATKRVRFDHGGWAGPRRRAAALVGRILHLFSRERMQKIEDTKSRV